MWAKELYGFADHLPETEEYGAASYVYRARRPFEPEKIISVLNGDLPGVIRTKGHFWIATRPDWVGGFSLAGALSSIKPLGIWWASVPKDLWPPQDSVQSYLAQHWQEPWEDCRQEIVFIGAKIDWADLKSRLDNALVPDAQAVSPQMLPAFSDPFPVWRMANQTA